MITSSVRRQASSHLAFSCSSVSCWLASFNMQSFVVHSYSHFNSDIMLSKVMQFVILEFCAVGSWVLYRRPRGIVIHSPQWRRFASITSWTTTVRLNDSGHQTDKEIHPVNPAVALRKLVRNAWGSPCFHTALFGRYHVKSVTSY